MISIDRDFIPGTETLSVEDFSLVQRLIVTAYYWETKLSDIPEVFLLSDEDFDALEDKVKSLGIPDFDYRVYVDKLLPGKSAFHPFPASKVAKEKSKISTQTYLESNKYSNLQKASTSLPDGDLPKYDGTGLIHYYHPEGDYLYSISRSSVTEGKIRTEKCIDLVPMKVTPGIACIETEAVICSFGNNKHEMEESFIGDLARQQVSGLVNSVKLDKRAECRSTVSYAAVRVRMYDRLEDESLCTLEEMEALKALPHIYKDGHTSFFVAEMGTGEYEGSRYFGRIANLDPDCPYQHFMCLADGIVFYYATTREEAIQKSLLGLYGNRDISKEYLNTNVVYSMYAYKHYYIEKKTTTMLEIEYNFVPESFVHVPKGILDPVMIEGTRVSRVSVSNPTNIKARGVGKGSRVEVIKSGSTIPHIERVVSEVSRVHIYIQKRFLGLFEESLRHLEHVEHVEFVGHPHVDFEFGSEGIDDRSIYVNINRFMYEEILGEMVKRSHDGDRLFTNQLAPKFHNASPEMISSQYESNTALATALNKVIRATGFKDLTSDDIDLENAICACGEELDISETVNGGFYCKNPECTTIHRQVMMDITFNPNIKKAVAKAGFSDIQRIDGEVFRKLIEADPQFLFWTYFRLPGFKTDKLRKDSLETPVTISRKMVEIWDNFPSEEISREFVELIKEHYPLTASHFPILEKMAEYNWIGDLKRDFEIVREDIEFKELMDRLLDKELNPQVKSAKYYAKQGFIRATRNDGSTFQVHSKLNCHPAKKKELVYSVIKGENQEQIIFL